MLIRRSVLIMPANNRKFIEKAFSRGADAICLDLEDSVSSAMKNDARGGIREAIVVAGRGGSDVLARINNGKDSIELDLQASIYPGLTGIVIPKVETAEEAKTISNIISRLERERNLPQNSVQIGVLVESARGFASLPEIAASTPRIVSIAIGHEDLCLDLGINPTTEGDELLYAKSKLVMVARVAGIAPMGLMGTLADFRDLEGLKKSALRAKSLGFKGASCIHPAQVQILNEAFGPSTGEVERSRKIVEVYNKAQLEGSGSVQFEGKMVDAPVFERSKKTVEFAEEIERFEAKKADSAKSVSVSEGG